MQVMQASESSSPVRVALLSDRWLSPAEWNRRGMTAERLRPVSFERLLIDPPAAIVLDPACGDTRQVADCWQLHDLLGVPVVVLAEDADSRQIEALLERGADEVVTGAPNAGLLAAQVAAILRRRQRQALCGVLPVLRLDSDIEVDMVRRTVRRAGSTQSLSRTEFNLLLSLVRAGGRACTHHELVTRVWGADCASATHYLRLYIRYLREKIEADPRHPRAILNVWGVGYRLALGQHSTIAPQTHVSPESHVSPVVESVSSQEASWSRSSSSPRPPRSITATPLRSAIAASR